ncbi:MAG TPA: hypothetical protein VGV38_02235, partial [Pyrinomonadaceae bacterium]|nr:hypothetical protein [Pyrinomonadaceae bacterium]
MITSKECMQEVLRAVPGFRRAWEAHLASWGGEPAGLCNDMSEFSRYLKDLIRGGRMVGVRPAFDLAERLLEEGDETVKDAAATCFLENMLAYASAGEIPANTFVHLLGPK